MFSCQLHHVAFDRLESHTPFPINVISHFGVTPDCTIILYNMSTPPNFGLLRISQPIEMVENVKISTRLTVSTAQISVTLAIHVPPGMVGWLKGPNLFRLNSIR